VYVCMYVNGQVVKAFDVLESEFVAIKIVKNRAPFVNQAKIELQLLQLINRYDSDSKYYIGPSLRRLFMSYLSHKSH